MHWPSTPRRLYVCIQIYIQSTVQCGWHTARIYRYFRSELVAVEKSDHTGNDVTRQRRQSGLHGRWKLRHHRSFFRLRLADTAALWRHYRLWKTSLVDKRSSTPWRRGGDLVVAIGRRHRRMAVWRAARWPLRMIQLATLTRPQLPSSTTRCRRGRRRRTCLVGVDGSLSPRTGRRRRDGAGYSARRRENARVERGRRGSREASIDQVVGGGTTTSGRATNTGFPRTTGFADFSRSLLDDIQKCTYDTCAYTGHDMHIVKYGWIDDTNRRIT